MASRAVASEVVTSTRLNEMIDYRHTFARQTAWSTTTGAKTGAVCLCYLAIPSAAYPSIVTVSALARGVLASSSTWDARLGYDTASDPGASVAVPAFQLQSCHMDNAATGATLNSSACLSGRFELPANTAAWIRLVLLRGGGTFTLGTAAGDLLSYDRIERFPAS